MIEKNRGETGSRSMRVTLTEQDAQTVRRVVAMNGLTLQRFLSMAIEAAAHSSSLNPTEVPKVMRFPSMDDSCVYVPDRKRTGETPENITSIKGPRNSSE